MLTRIFHRPGEHEAPARPQNEGWTFKECCRDLASDGCIERHLARNGNETGVDSLSVAQELLAHARTGSIRAPTSTSLSALDPILEAHSYLPTSRKRLKTVESLAEYHRVFETLE